MNQSTTEQLEKPNKFSLTSEEIEAFENSIQELVKLCHQHYGIKLLVTSTFELKKVSSELSVAGAGSGLQVNQETECAAERKQKFYRLGKYYCVN